MALSRVCYSDKAKFIYIGRDEEGGKERERERDRQTETETERQKDREMMMILYYSRIKI